MGWLTGWLGKEKKETATFVQATDELFAQTLHSAAKPILLFLWSNTCPYCRKMVPNVKNVAARHAGNLIAMQANAAEVPGIAQALDLRGVPATAFFHQGKLLELVGGFQPEEYLEQIIARIAPV